MNQYVYKKQALKNNLNKKKCYHLGSMHNSVLKGEANFEQEEEDVKFLCILKTLKKITAGIDNKDNKKFMIHE